MDNDNDAVTSHCESSPGSSDECRAALSRCRPADQANNCWLLLSTSTIAIYYYIIIVM